MNLNERKGKVIPFTRKRPKIVTDYHISEHLAERVHVTNDLGVLYVTKLRFNFHIDNILVKAFKMSGFIMRQFWEFKKIETIKLILCIH